MDSAHRPNKNFIAILFANVILGSIMPMLIVLGGLAGLKLAPSTTLATLPTSFQMLAALIVATPVSLFMGKRGRKVGFLLGVIIAFFGGLCGAYSLYLNNFWMLCLSHVLLGSALASFNYFRFAAGETVAEEWQSVAISFTLGSGLLAALLGPEVFIRTKDLLQPVQFSGAYIAISTLAVVGSIPLFFLHLGATKAKTIATEIHRKNAFLIIRRPEVSLALVAAAVSAAVMVFLMAPTPIAMIGHGHSEVTAGNVIRWHVIAMFAPSFITGFLIKRFGVMAIISVGMAVLASSAISALAGHSQQNFYAALVLLGVGWNFGFIGSTTLIAKLLTPAERPLVQGVNETVIALAGTLAAFLSGTVVANWGWTGIAASSLPLIAIASVGMIFGARMMRSRNVV